MSCTTILVGKNASWDGSTMIARNDDSGADHYTPKKFCVVDRDEQSGEYHSVLSKGRSIPLPEHSMRYTCVPNVLEGKGIWAASGINEVNVGMTATETITSNARVLGADPLMIPDPSDPDSVDPALIGGIGEEDLVVLVLPYIHSAREGVVRLGGLLEEYGTYEMNGIGFVDRDEIWWMETIGGHHWIARRVPDDSYVVMPNQFGTDWFDLEDAFGTQKEYMCSQDLRKFIADNHLDLTMNMKPFPHPGPGMEMKWAPHPGPGMGFGPGPCPGRRAGRPGPGFLDARAAFGSHDDSDHVYNTPRAWFMERYLNPHSFRWDGPGADFTPESDDIPWCLVPEKKITPEDIKYVLSSHYQGTPFDPYGSHEFPDRKGKYRSIGVNRTDFMALLCIRPYVPEDICAVEYIAFASNAFNAMIPLYANVQTAPEYLSGTEASVSTENFYWTSRLIAVLADQGGKCRNLIERYQNAMQAKGHVILNQYDRRIQEETEESCRAALREEANEKMAEAAKILATDTLGKLLGETSNHMKNAFARSDA